MDTLEHKEFSLRDKYEDERDLCDTASCSLVEVARRLTHHEEVRSQHEHASCFLTLSKPVMNR
jgi:hypothetical protein